MNLSTPAKRALALSAALVLVIAGAVLVIRVVDLHQRRAASEALLQHPWTKLLAKARTLHRPERLREADSVACLALQMAIDSVGPDSPDVARCLELRAAIAYGTARKSESESLERLAVRIRARDSTNLGAMTNDLGILGMIAGKRGRFQEAESLYRQVFELGENGFTTAEDAAFGLDRLGMLHLAQGDLTGAESLLQHAAQRYRAIGGEQPQLLIVLDSLAVIYTREGRGIEAERARREAAKQR